MNFFQSAFIVLIALTFFSCEKDMPVNSYKATKLVVIVLDGARYSETMGDSSKSNIPNISMFADNGVNFTNFYNNGITNTNNGHVAITTGIYENINNSGIEYPTKPSFMNWFLFEKNKKKTDACIITSKDKLEILAYYKDSVRLPLPYTDCGINGNMSGYRNDSVTTSRALQVLSIYQPDILFVNFKEPDASGHSGNWNNYLLELKKSDAYAGRIIDFINNHPAYKNKTTLFITNDHGRHSNGWLDGYVSHGDNCNGCKHIMLVASGPDIKKSVEIKNNYEMIDLYATVCNLMNVNNNNNSKGKVIRELFK